MEELKNVDLEFVEKEGISGGMDEEEAKEMDSTFKYLAEIRIKKDGKVINVIEPKMYNKELIQGETPEDDFAVLNVYKP